MNYDKIEVKNYLIHRLVEAETAIQEVKRFLDTPENNKEDFPNIITRCDLALEEINDIRRGL